ncbi:MAG: hypothetical protein WC353_05200 [Candidatus Peribacter sp.]
MRWHGRVGLASWTQRDPLMLHGKLESPFHVDHPENPDRENRCRGPSPILSRIEAFAIPFRFRAVFDPRPARGMTTWNSVPREVLIPRHQSDRPKLPNMAQSLWIAGALILPASTRPSPRPSPWQVRLTERSRFP